MSHVSNASLRNKTVFGADCQMEGNMALDNDAAVMGRFNGTLKVTGVLDLMDTSQFRGLIITGTLRLAGKAEADVIASEGVELLAGAELRGRVFTPRMSVAEGVVLEADACIGPNAAQRAEQRLAQIELQDQLAQERSGAVHTNDEYPTFAHYNQPMPLSLAADQPLNVEYPADSAGTTSTADSSHGETFADAAEVRTMSDAFQRILSFRPTKVIRPYAHDRDDDESEHSSKAATPAGGRGRPAAKAS